ncbi:MAG: AbrB/MazE/SpoVT family DNA-binding domain-containing protein [Candidatus Bipolaricaulia bacterium]
MPTVKIGLKHQITIPAEIFKKLNLEVGDFVEIQIKDKHIILIPQKLIPKDQAWFWTKEWQAKEREADEAIREGRVHGPFDNVEDLIKDLES